MKLICSKCNYEGETKEFSPLTINKNKVKVVDGEEVTVRYSKTDYMCPKCLHSYIGGYEPNGYY